jgi:hypothetical protein
MDTPDDFVGGRIAACSSAASSVPGGALRARERDLAKTEGVSAR